MIKVHILKSGSINNLVGPTGTIMRLLENRELLISKGYDLQVFTSESIKKKRSESHKIGKNHRHPIFIIKQRIKYRIQKSYFFSLIMALRSLYNARKFVKSYLANNLTCEIIQFHDIFVAMEYVRATSKPLPKKILFFHNDGRKLEMFYQNFPKLRHSLFSKYLEKKFEVTVSNMTQLVFISNNGKNNFINEHSEFNTGKTTVIHNGIYDLTKELLDKSIDRINISSNRVRMVSVGTVNTRKGQRKILEAINGLSKKIQNKLEVHIIGDGPDLPILKDFINSNKLDKIVKLRGGMDRENVNAELSKADIYILFSEYEGLPISIIEAMRSGLPIISTSIAGIPELVENNSNGILINPNVDELKEVLEGLENINWPVLGRNSRSIFEEKFTFEKMLQHYIDLLDKINA